MSDVGLLEFNLRHYELSPLAQARILWNNMGLEASQESVVWFEDGAVTPARELRDEEKRTRIQRVWKEKLLPEYYALCEEKGIPKEIAESGRKRLRFC